MNIAIEAAEVLIIFASALLAFACLARVIFFDFAKVYDSPHNYAAFNYESFLQSFYSMIVGVSTTSFPKAMLFAYKEHRPAALFFILNTFIMNIIMLNLIMATFYFYYQNFYIGSVRVLNTKVALV